MGSELLICFIGSRVDTAAALEKFMMWQSICSRELS
jgi:hypothetical protein